MGPHFMLLLSIYVLYSNVTDISCIMSCGNKIVSKLFQIVRREMTSGAPRDTFRCAARCLQVRQVYNVTISNNVIKCS